MTPAATAVVAEPVATVELVANPFTILTGPDSQPRRTVRLVWFSFDGMSYAWRLSPDDESSYELVRRAGTSRSTQTVAVYASVEDAELLTGTHPQFMAMLLNLRMLDRRVKAAREAEAPEPTAAAPKKRVKSGVPPVRRGRQRV